MGVLDFMRKMDFFGEQFHLSMNGEQKVKTTLGFLFTLIFYVAILLCGGFFVLEYLDTSSPDGERREVSSPSAPLLTINKDSFFIFFMIQNNEKFIQSSNISKYIDMKIDIVKYSFASTDSPIASSSITHSLGFVSCQELPWYRDSRLNISSNEYVIFDTFSVCPDTREFEIEIKGYEEEVEYIEMHVYIDKSSSSSAISLPTSPSLDLWTLILQTGYDKSDPKKPLNLNRDYRYKYKIVEGLSKEVSLKLSQVVSVSNTGILGDTSIVEKGAFLMDENAEAFATASPRLIDLKLASSNVYLEYTRSYTPLYQLISNVGGVIEIVAFIVALLYSQFNSYVGKKNLTRFGIMKKNQSINLLENTGDPIDPESFDYTSLVKLKLINKKFLKPKNDIEKKRASFLKACEQLAIERCDIYKIIKNMNELIVFKNLFFTKAHRKLSPIVGISLLEDFDFQSTDRQEKNMSIADAIEMLDDNRNNENAIQKEISIIIKEILEESEKANDPPRNKEADVKSKVKLGGDDDNINRVGELEMFGKNDNESIKIVDEKNQKVGVNEQKEDLKSEENKKEPILLPLQLDE